MLERLQKVLAAAGVASRRDAEAMITSGRVQVDGRPVTELGTKVDPERAAILVDGRPIVTRPPSLYVALHKPAGFVTTRADPHAPRTVMELVLPGLEARFGRGHPSVEGLHPVGRLDRDSEGLLLLTNDGAFTQALTHPRHGVTKRYLAHVAGHPTPAELQHLRSGVLIEGRPTAPAQARPVPGSAGRDGSKIEIELREGRKRQVRLMLAAIGHPVRHLTRTAIGPLTLGSLKLGQFRMLTPGEVLALLETASLKEARAVTSDSKAAPARTARPGSPVAARKASAKTATASPKSGKIAESPPKQQEDRERKMRPRRAVGAPRRPREKS